MAAIFSGVLTNTPAAIPVAKLFGQLNVFCLEFERGLRLGATKEGRVGKSFGLLGMSIIVDMLNLYLIFAVNIIESQRLVNNNWLL